MPVLPKIAPINPVLRSRPFDNSDYIFELKYDGFRAMAYLQNGTCELISRNKHVFGTFKGLRAWLAENLQVRDAIIDGEICYLDESGTPRFNDLTTGTGPPYFAAFDLLWLDGEDLRALPLIDRKKRLKPIMLAAPAFMFYVDHVEQQGQALFELICAKDLEGIVAKPKQSTYDPAQTKWFKIKNPHYSQREGRREMFNSFKGYNDVAHVKELSKEVTFVPADKSHGRRELWHRAAKTGVAYQESFVLREPVVVPATPSKQKPLESKRRSVLPRSKQTFSHPELVLWADTGITKADLILYYDSIAPFVLLHIERRPLMLERHPDGVGKKWFLQKDALPDETLAWVQTQKIWASSRDEGSRYISYHLGSDRDQLLHLAELCTTTIHTWATTADAPDYADMLILDLDPFNVPFSTVQQVALVAKDVLDELELRGYLKTSGATGLHILVPLIPNTFTHDRVRLIAASIAKLIVDRRPDIATVEQLIRDRKGKVYVDFGQNGRGRTMACVYSPRARAGAPVSAPLRWDELTRPIDPDTFNIRTILKRLDRVGDLFSEMSRDRQDITAFCEALQR